MANRSAAALLTYVPVAYVVSQSGSHSGITNTLYTHWLPSGVAFSSLAGSVSFAGNLTGFSEALVTIGTTADNQEECSANNGIWPTQTPVVRRLWVGILKDNTAQTVSIPVNVTLPNAVSLAATQAGTCLATLVSAGYPFLARSSARYTQTTINLSLGLSAAWPSAPIVTPSGLGGEFRFNTAAGPSADILVAIKAAVPLAVDGIAGSVSAAAVLGAPPGAGWTPTPTGAWAMGTEFIYMHAATCQAAGLVFPPPNGTLSVLRRATPAPFTPPAGSVTVASLPVSAYATRPVQASSYTNFTSPSNPGYAPLALAPGDCLLTLQHLLTPATAIASQIDYENQSTLYLRVMP